MYSGESFKRTAEIRCGISDKNIENPGLNVDEFFEDFLMIFLNIARLNFVKKNSLTNEHEFE